MFQTVYEGDYSMSGDAHRDRSYERPRGSSGRDQSGPSRSLEQHRAEAGRNQAARDSYDVRRGLPQGPSPTDASDIEIGSIHQGDINRATNHMISHFPQNQLNDLFEHLESLEGLIRRGDNNKVIHTLYDWTSDQDRTKRVFAEKAIQYARRREQRQ